MRLYRPGLQGRERQQEQRHLVTDAAMPRRCRWGRNRDALWTYRSEREIIAHMHRDGKSQTRIAERLGRDKSTVPRELRRNRSRNGYWAVAAQRKAERRRSERPWVAKMDRPDVRKYVTRRLRWRWSPDEIEGPRVAIFRAIGGGRFRTRRFTPGFVPRRPRANTGSVICDAWGESGKTGKTGGGSLPA